MLFTKNQKVPNPMMSQTTHPRQLGQGTWAGSAFKNNALLKPKSNKSRRNSADRNKSTEKRKRGSKRSSQINMDTVDNGNALSVGPLMMGSQEPEVANPKKVA